MLRVLLLATAVVGLAGSSAAGSPPSSRQERVLEGRVERSFRLGYLLYLPSGYDESTQRWPLLLYLHGGRGRGTDLGKLDWYPLPRMLDSGQYENPFVVVVPQCPEGETWTDTDALIALLDDVQAKYRVDPERVYLVGYSMGGNGAWYLAYRHPERFAAVAPMSGPANPWWAGRLRHTPIWVFHGAKDELVPARESQEMVTALRAEGNDVRFSLDPDRGHSPPDTEEHLALFDWLLAQHGRRGESPDSLPDPLQAGWRGNRVCEQVRDDDRLRVLRCVFPPGVGHERHFHAPHFGYVVAGGRMRMTDADGVRELELATGSSFDSGGVAWHEVLNVGDTTAVFLIVEPK